MYQVTPYTAIFFPVITLLVILLLHQQSASADWPTFVVKYDNSTYYVLHVEQGGSIKNITAVLHGIHLDLLSERGGQVQVAIPKELLNATDIQYDDLKGFDGKVFEDKIATSNYTSIETETKVIFTIPFAMGTKEIDISVKELPEFNGIVFAVMGLSLAGIIFAGMKFRNRSL